MDKKLKTGRQNKMNYKNPYENCPILETELFLLRLVEEGDAEDLLVCYSDRESVKIFNSDNCPIDFYFESQDELLKLIKFWLMEYSNAGYVRFSIVDKAVNKAVGTIEIFAKNDNFENYGKIGVLRLDLASSYEEPEFLIDILKLTERHFGEIFKIDSMITKAKPYAKTRIKILKTLNFSFVSNKQITKYEDYYIKKL